MSEVQCKRETTTSPFGWLGLDIWTEIIAKCVRYNSEDKTYSWMYGYEAMPMLNDSFLAIVARSLAIRKHISFTSGRDFVSFWKGLVVNNSLLIIENIEYIHIHFVDHQDATLAISALSCLGQKSNSKIHITFDRMVLHKVIGVSSAGPTWFEVLAEFKGDYKLTRRLKTAIAKINEGKGHEPSHKPMTKSLSRILRQDELPEFRQIEEQLLQLRLNLRIIDGLAIWRSIVYNIQLVLQFLVSRGEMMDEIFATWAPILAEQRQQADLLEPIPDFAHFPFHDFTKS